MCLEGGTVQYAGRITKSTGKKISVAYDDGDTEETTVDKCTLENGGKLDQSKPSPQKIKLIKTREQTELIGQIGFYIFLALLVTGFCLIFGGLLLRSESSASREMATLPLNIGQQLSFFVLGCGVLLHCLHADSGHQRDSFSWSDLDVFGITEVTLSLH